MYDLLRKYCHLSIKYFMDTIFALTFMYNPGNYVSFDLKVDLR